jgi:hypothetical protein
MSIHFNYDPSTADGHCGYPRGSVRSPSRGAELAGAIVQVTNIMVQKALEGDVKAAEWVGAVLQAVAAGKLSVEEGDKLAGTIGRLGEAVHRIVEERLNALEAAQPVTVTSLRTCSMDETGSASPSHMSGPRTKRHHETY